jgi:hypothetical protein
MSWTYFTARICSADGVTYRVLDAQEYVQEFKSLNAAKKAATRLYRGAEAVSAVPIVFAAVDYFDGDDSHLAAQKFGADGEWINAVLD